MQYFLTTAVLFTGIFVVLHFFSTVLFMISEISPYARLAVFFSIVAVDYFLVNYIVNVKLSSRWKREAPDLMDAIQVPEPEYVMDEETARKLETEKAQAAATPKQPVRKGIIAKLLRSLAPVDDDSPEVVRENREEPGKPVTAPKPQPRHAAHSQGDASTSSDMAGAPQQPSAAKGWQKRLDEMETAKLSEVLPILEQHDVKAEPVSAREEKQVKKDIAGKPESEVKQTSRRLFSGRRKEKTETQPSKPSKKQVKERKRRKAGKKEKPNAAVSESSESLSASASSWSVPFDEMETEELETAVEKAMDGGYNPTSKERNK